MISVRTSDFLTIQLDILCDAGPYPERWSWWRRASELTGQAKHAREPRPSAIQRRYDAVFSKMGIEAPVDAEGEDEGEEAFSMECSELLEQSHPSSPAGKRESHM